MTRSVEASDFPLGPELDFLQRLWRLSHALERVSSRMDKRLGITAQQRFIIRCVGKYPGISAGQLAAVLHVDAGTVSAAVRRLEQKGHIDRRRDPRDGRRVRLGLTGQGRALDAPTMGTVEAAVERLFASCSRADTSAAIRLLDRFSSLLDETLGSEA